MFRNYFLKFLFVFIACIYSTFSFAQGCAFSVSVVPTHVKCNGMSTGVAVANPSPAGTYTYLWSTGETTKSIANLAAATYFVRVTDKNGCEIMEFITITEPPKLENTAVLFHPVCYNENSGSIVLDTKGGVEPYTFTWSNNCTTSQNMNLYSGTYNNTITDANFCTVENVYTLIQPDQISITSVVEDVKGYGLSDGSVQVTTFGGVHPYDYAWTSFNSFSATTEDLYNVPSDTFSLVITDVKNCTFSTKIFVPQPPPLSLDAQITDVFCNAFSDGVVDVHAHGGVPPYRYTWANSEILLEETSPTLTEISTGTYYLTITDYNDITLEDSFFVDEPHKLVANISTTDAICFDSLNGNAYLTVSGGAPPYSFMWSNKMTTQNILRVHAGYYSVEVVDTNGCFLRVETTIKEPDSIAINSTIEHITCKDHYNGKIFTDVSGGISPYVYSWSTGATTEKVDMLDEGIYTVTVTDAHNCPVSRSDEVTVPFNGCIEIPNAFSPNDDGINDQWVIQNSYLYPEIDVLVLNEDGFTVFEDRGYETDWDGTRNDYDVPSGTYYYIINLNNGDLVYKGIVTILR